MAACPRFSRRAAERTTLKQAISWMIDPEHLPAACRIKMPLNKSCGADTHGRQSQT